MLKHSLSESGCTNSRLLSTILNVKMATIAFLLTLSSSLVLVGCTGSNPAGVTVTFPSISEPIQITGGDKEHFFASYYGINSWSTSQRYVTVLQTDIKYSCFALPLIN